jgi:hypothetical protein
MTYEIPCEYLAMGRDEEEWCLGGEKGPEKAI